MTKHDDLHPSGTARAISASVVANVIRNNTAVEPTVFKCPCSQPDCNGQAVFARYVEDGDTRVYLIFTTSSTLEGEVWPCYMAHDLEIQKLAVLDIPEDAGQFPVPYQDLRMLRAYLDRGLKEAMLAA